ncbi:MAG TPA: hypothetical protein PKD61_33260 [Polyangiaceae bacterium]|nr:hypothetical protein [Polyangiaceae bacterium]
MVCFGSGAGRGRLLRGGVLESGQCRFGGPSRPKINWSLGSGNTGTCFLSMTAADRGTDPSFYIAVRPAGQAGFQIPEYPAGLESYAPAATDKFRATRVSHVWSPTAGVASCAAVLGQQEQQSVVTASQFGDFD